MISYQSLLLSTIVLNDRYLKSVKHGGLAEIVTFNYVHMHYSYAQNMIINFNLH